MRNQSIKKELPKARKSARDQVATGFGFESNWL